MGPYEITGELGAGGMGIVMRACDTTLDRDVALKVLPDAFTSDPDRLARFEREAKVLASLNHPNIESIYGIAEQDPSTSSEQASVRALVLELVEGPTLAELIAARPSPRPSPIKGEGVTGRVASRPAMAPQPLLMASQQAPSPPGLAKASDEAPANGEGFYRPETHRVRGAMLMLEAAAAGESGPSRTEKLAEAERCFGDAIESARRLGARSWELRAALDLSRLLQSQGRADEGRRALAELYTWFTEGLDTPDLVEARRLLEPV